MKYRINETAVKDACGYLANADRIYDTEDAKKVLRNLARMLLGIDIKDVTESAGSERVICCSRCGKERCFSPHLRMSLSEQVSDAVIDGWRLSDNNFSNDSFYCPQCSETWEERQGKNAPLCSARETKDTLLEIVTAESEVATVPDTVYLVVKNTYQGEYTEPRYYESAEDSSEVVAAFYDEQEARKTADAMNKEAEEAEAEEAGEDEEDEEDAEDTVSFEVVPVKVTF